MYSFVHLVFVMAIVDRRHEALLQLQFRSIHVQVESEYRFAAMHVGPGKKLRERLSEAGLKDWRFDFALVDHMIAIEIEGGAWTNGRHTRGSGFHEDLLKYDAAMRLGWTIYRCDGAMVKSGRALNTILQLIGYAL